MRGPFPPFACTLLLSLVWASAADWPQWRYDAGHTAHSPEQLAEDLHLQWILTFSQRDRVWDDPLNHDLMSYDRNFEPVVAGDLLFLTFSERDKLAAFDLETGVERWAYYADGPLWFAPVVSNGRVYAASDDGHLYCLKAETGELLWKFRGAPDDIKVLGNRRVISAWPARGGPVLLDGSVYFAASIWPFMGTFIYALDAETGRVQWVNDGTGAQYIKQPHAAPSFGGVAPQGTLVAMPDFLLVPGGRSVPAAYDRKTGDFVHFHLDAGGKANGGSFVAGHGDEFFVHTRFRGVRAYELKSGKKTGFTANEPVLTGDLLYTSAPQPNLKTRLEAAERAAKGARGSSNKARKQLENAIKEKEKPLDEHITKRDETQTKADEAKKALEELEAAVGKDSKDKKLAEAKKKAADTDKAAKDAAKKLDDEKKKREKPIDPKLYANLAKAELEDCEKSNAYHELKTEWETRGRDVRVVQAHNKKKELVWEFEADATGDLIKAGDRLYAAGKDEIVAISDLGDAEKAAVTWRQSIDGEVQRLLAANGKLVAVTLDGRIFVYGDTKSDHPLKPPRAGYASKEWPFSTSSDNKLARQVLALADVNEGYAICYGVDDGRLLEAMAEESDLHIVAVEQEQATVDGLRRKFDYMKLYGKRLVLHQGDPTSFQAPPYIASLVMLGESFAENLQDSATIQQIYDSVRPYGGALWFPRNPKLVERLAALQLPEAELVPGPGGSTFVLRQGALPDSADWTHMYGDMRNSVKSDDKLVKLPLGLLWFGGSPNTDVLPRHGHGPSEQVVGGRNIIEGMNCISARDVYTGRVLWKREFENLGTYGVYYDHTYTDDPLNPAYNQVHIPGANGRGTNYIATEDSVYVAIGSACHILDAASGQERQIFEMPKSPNAKTRPAWGFIGVYEDLLFAGNDFANFVNRHDLNREEREKKEKEAAEKAAKAEAEGKTKPKKDRKRKRKRKKKENPEVVAIEDLSASLGLIAFDRHTGDEYWRVDAEFSFLHNAIVAGNDRVYVLDKLPKSREEKMKRRGLAQPEDYRLLCVSAKDGSLVWERRGGVFGTWLSYSKRHDILLQAGAKSRDRLKDEVGEGMIAYRGSTGEILWEERKRAYSGPCIIHNDLVLTAPYQYSDSSGAFHIVDGTPYLIRNPLTGQMEPWRITRAYGCNTPVAGEYLLTFRSGAAGYYDLDNMSGTGNFGGFKSGCTSNLIPANGVLNAPDYTRTCSCGYQNQTSLALVHMPDVELWTYNRFGADAASDEAVERVGINLGAPGDRRADDGTLWLEHPGVGGESPEVTVEIKGEKVDYFRRHSAQVDTEQPLPWVAASGVRNAETITLTPKMRFKAAAKKDTHRLAILIPEGDAEEMADGSINLISSDLEMTFDEGPQIIGLHFQDVQLFQGETISKAYVQFTVDEPNEAPKKDAKKPKEGDEEKLFIHIEDAIHAEPFREADHDISSRPKLEKSVEWKPKLWLKKDEAKEDQRSPDIAPLLQEIVNKSDWKFGNSVSLVISGQAKRVAHAQGKDPLKAPRLVIETDGTRPRVRVAAKEDDAEERADGSISLDSGDLELVIDKDKPGDQVIGIRFRHLQIPRGQVLEEAYIQFTVDEELKDSPPTDLEIRIEDNVDAAQFKNEKHHLTNRKTLQEAVKWSPGPWPHKLMAYGEQRTPNIAPLIQSIINRSEWKPGNSIAFILKGTGRRIATSFDGKKELAPKLVLNYRMEDETISLDEAPRYTVRLHFFDPDHAGVGQRRFHVSLQGERVLESFDVAQVTSSDERVFTKTFSSVPVPRQVAIGLEKTDESVLPPLLSGVELILE